MKRNEEHMVNIRNILPYMPAIVMIWPAGVLALSGAPVWAAVAFGAAGASFWAALSLQRRLSKAIQQRINLDQQLIHSQKLASIGELSSGIAHEINNPLAIIGQEVEWIRHVVKTDLAENREGTAELEDSLQEIKKQIDRCGDITHKLLDFARKKEPLFQSTDINKLIEDMARLVERDAVQKNIRIVRDYGKDAPFVHTDPPLLRQVVLNLLNNAVQAIGADGEITIKTETPGNGSVEILVSDTGCGIPAENLNKIFDPFFTTKPPGKGTGLGLSICHGIVGKLGGRISVVSEVGRGATFSVHLPAMERKGEI